jgi:hypothetical protein
MPHPARPADLSVLRSAYRAGVAIPLDLWGQRRWARVEVVGEAFYAPHIRALFGASLKDRGEELTVTVQLVPDPGNAHDRNAIGVWAGARQLGHLSREDAATYAPVLSRLAGQGWLPQVAARIWASEYQRESYDYDRDEVVAGDMVFHSSVRVSLAEPHMLVPVNLPPSDQHRLLPEGGAIQVTGEDKHLDVLSPLVPTEGEGWVYVTLHDVAEQLARSTREIVEVRIDGARVGQLTPKMSQELLPAVRHLAARGEAAAARAIVKGNRIKAEVVLHVVRAHELPDTWLEAEGTTPHAAAAGAPPSPAQPARRHRPIPPMPTGIRFVTPPGWPAPPEGWTPFPGWAPEPAWPPAPEDWRWWEPTWVPA